MGGGGCGNGQRTLHNGRKKKREGKSLEGPQRSFLLLFSPFSPLLLNTPGTFLHSFAQQQQQQLFLCAAFLKAVGHKFTRPEFPRHLFS